MTRHRPTKIVCVGRNYAKHAAELGNDVPAEPLIFLKPPSAVIADGEAIVHPGWVGRVDYEGEIAVVIGRRARHVSPDEAWEVVAGVAPLNDVTARDLQRSDGQWSRAKGFDTFCPVGPVRPLDRVELERLAVRTLVNGSLRQEAAAAEMVFDVPTLIAHITRVMTLEPGDLVATGTPEGIGPLQPGDTVTVEVEGVGRVTNPVVAEGDG